MVKCTPVVSSQRLKDAANSRRQGFTETVSRRLAAAAFDDAFVYGMVGSALDRSQRVRMRWMDNSTAGTRNIGSLSFSTDVWRGGVVVRLVLVTLVHCLSLQTWGVVA